MAGGSKAQLKGHITETIEQMVGDNGWVYESISASQSVGVEEKNILMQLAILLDPLQYIAVLNRLGGVLGGDLLSASSEDKFSLMQALNMLNIVCHDTPEAKGLYMIGNPDIPRQKNDPEVQQIFAAIQAEIIRKLYCKITFFTAEKYKIFLLALYNANSNNSWLDKNNPHRYISQYLTPDTLTRILAAEKRHEEGRQTLCKAQIMIALLLNGIVLPLVLLAKSQAKQNQQKVTDAGEHLENLTESWHQWLQDHKLILICCIMGVASLPLLVHCALRSGFKAEIRDLADRDPSNCLKSDPLSHQQSDMLQDSKVQDYLEAKEILPVRIVLNSPEENEELTLAANSKLQYVTVVRDHASSKGADPRTGKEHAL